jgi:hypothetical protein
VVRLELPGASLFLHYEPGNARNRTAVARVIATMLRSAHRTFRRAFASTIAVVSGPRRNLWAGRMSGSLNAAELEQFNRHLRRALKVLEDARKNPERAASTPLYEFTFVLTPNAASVGAHSAAERPKRNRRAVAAG